jgi:predicted phosphoserine aminotransferase
MHKRLFLPGPVEVYPDILKAMATPMVYHRAKDYQQLHARVREKLKKLLYVKDGHVLLFTSSSTGAMEAGVRNLVKEKVLCTACGAFGERWHQIAVANGKEADPLFVEWGRGIHAEDIEKKLKEKKYDAMLLVHNETSTGVMNHLDEIAEVMKKFPEILWLVDAVSSMAGVKIEPEKLGIDFIFAGTQKGFGLPPGLTVVYASKRAVEKAKQIKNRGYYFDLPKYVDFDKKDQTPETPTISHIFALDLMLDKAINVGLDNFFKRTYDMAIYCRKWATQKFRLFPEEGYESLTLTAITNTLNINTSKLNEELGKRGMMISGGYGKLKEKTFRIAHMADITMRDLKELLENIDDIIEKKLC